jgi:HEAT repeat protein
MLSHGRPVAPDATNPSMSARSISVSRTPIIGAIALLTVASAPSFAQGTIVERVSKAPDGVVRMQYASRPGTCGDGGNSIGYRTAFFMESMQSFGGHWTAPQCVPGPVRVALTVSGGKVARVQTYVGGTWAAASGRVTDFGTVSPTDASAYFFALVPELERGTRKEKLLLPAVLADDPNAVARLTALAREGTRTEETRRQAIQWIGLIGDASVVPTLLSFVRSDLTPVDTRDDDADADTGKHGIAPSAVAALSFVRDGAGVPALIDLARSGTTPVRRSAVFWLGQSGDARAFAALHTIIENRSESESVRSRAIFSLSHGDATPASEFTYLRTEYGRLSSARLREAILMGMAEDANAGPKWLLERAGDRAEPVELRKKALFWAGQADATLTKDLVAYYQRTNEPELREHALFVLSQREDQDALNELLRIAQSDSDKRMRSRAMFWLAQKDDPRVAKLISDRVTH